MAHAVVPDISMRAVTGLNGIGDEDHGAVAHQDVTAALVATAGSVQAFGERIVSTTADFAVWRQDGRDAGVDGHAICPLVSALDLDAVGGEVGSGKPKAWTSRIDLRPQTLGLLKICSC